jgi:hypothetical protein
VCSDATACQTLPLADFGSTRFTLARAETTGGRTGAISDRAWGRTRISLKPGGRRLIAAEQSGAGAGESTPSSLAANGSTFTVTYSRVAMPGSQFARARQASLQDGQLVH